MDAAGRAPSTVQVRDTISPATTGDEGLRILRDRGFATGVIIRCRKNRRRENKKHEKQKHVMRLHAAKTISEIDSPLISKDILRMKGMEVALFETLHVNVESKDFRVMMNLTVDVTVDPDSGFSETDILVFI
jgi:hypothetical protein